MGRGAGGFVFCVGVGSRVSLWVQGLRLSSFRVRGLGVLVFYDRVYQCLALLVSASS